MTCACNWWAYLGGGIGLGTMAMLLLGYPLMEGWSRNRYADKSRH